MEPVFQTWVLVLWALSELGEDATAYGAYRLINANSMRSEATMLSPQSVYRAVMTLRRRGMVVDSERRDTNPSRGRAKRFIKLTALGEEELERALDIIHEAYWTMVAYSG